MCGTALMSTLAQFLSYMISSIKVVVICGQPAGCEVHSRRQICPDKCETLHRTICGSIILDQGRFRPPRHLEIVADGSSVSSQMIMLPGGH